MRFLEARGLRSRRHAEATLRHFLEDFLHLHLPSGIERLCAILLDDAVHAGIANLMANRGRREATAG